MMSNCAFWSRSGELLAVHGFGPPEPRISFGHWVAARRFPPGRMVDLSAQFPLEAPGPGWHALAGAPETRKKAGPVRDSSAPVAVAAPALDSSAARLFPPLTVHEKFTLKAWPTWTATARPGPDEGVEGWYAALAGEEKTSRFLIRLVPYQGRLPGEGWRNMLAWSLRHHLGVRLVPLNGLPSVTALAAAPAWEYRVEAGRGPDAAAWDVQLLPSRVLLAGWAPGVTDLWEATALLRWVRPGAPEPGYFSEPPQGEPRWADLFSRLPPADARLLVQNVLTTLPGGAAGAAGLFFDTVTLSPGADGRTLVRHVPQEGLPASLLSTLFGRSAWAEIDRAKRYLPPPGELRELRTSVLADLDLRLAEGRLVWSAGAQELWQNLYREPRHRVLSDRLAGLRSSDRWATLLAGDPLVPETLFRRLDVTDAALCLRDAPDSRWRRFVTGRREAELKAELEFCAAWAARGELTVERQLEAWEAWDEILSSLVQPADGRPK